MSKGVIAAIISASLVVACVAFVVVLLLVKLLWAWTVPDLFPGAVQQGLVAAEITWLTAMKVALFVAVIGGIATGGGPELRYRHGSARVS
jgi:hypothetical protein